MASRVANAMKEWALANGATHYTHWFQPMTGSTAEKHDSFLHWSPKSQKFTVDFTAKALVQGESDASSFPTGGIRATFEARGYTVWDMSSPAFLKHGPNGSTLYIPTAFCSWRGDALDNKTPLLRSEQAVSMAATDLIHLLDENSSTQACFSKCGPEQEFFLIDRSHYLARPDLVHVKKAVIGDKPIASQEYVFHYYGETPGRVLAFLQEAEIELSKVGIPMLARHNEVAPGQFEMAPIFEPSSLAVDHNMLMMNILSEVAIKHGFEVLFHEKPFSHVNGSGKHVNYSLHVKEPGITNDNIYHPGVTPLENMRFVVFLAAMLRGIHIHSDLLQACITCPGNEDRLGGHEAPPAIISVYLGHELDEVCRTLMGEKVLVQGSPRSINLGISALPELPRDMSDRNRTSPLAFTGNRFEFRCVGASQSIAPPLTILNAILADSCRHMAELISNNMKTMPKYSAIQQAVRETLLNHHSIVYNGDNFAEAYIAEATQRGLPHFTSVPEILNAFDNEVNVVLFETNGILSRREQQARSIIWRERYLGTMITEANVQLDMARTLVLPAATKHQEHSLQGFLALKQFYAQLNEPHDLEPQKKHLLVFNETINALLNDIDKMDSLLTAVSFSHEDIFHKFPLYHPQIKAIMNDIRLHCDRLERICDASIWSIPRFSDILCY
uniref:Uncharacterized protein n=1 Tax=Arcella intermedia TaxID=1963864 RepID=A0A6B2KZ49_9EUKA